MAAAKRGDLNPAKKPGVGAKISAAHKASGRFAGANHPNFKGEWINRGRSWVWINDAEMIEFETSKHYVQKARYVWNRAHPEDPVRKGEHIHHMNHDKMDDRPENLQKLTNREHQLHHQNEPHAKASVSARFSGRWSAKRRETFDRTGR